MFRSLAVTNDSRLLTDIPLDGLSDPKIQWYWVDFYEPDENDAVILEQHFRFHPLTVDPLTHLGATVGT